jgi:hypothetical protein
MSRPVIHLPASRCRDCFFALALVALCGCGKGGGGERGAGGERGVERFSSGVNGLTVLGDMFSDAGHTVSLRKTISPVLRETVDVIVWAPDDFNPPDRDTCDRLDRWLRAKEDRTLIYIGRDFDAQPVYWRKIIDQTPPAKQADYRKELDAAEAWFLAERSGLPPSAKCPWFKLDRKAPYRDIRLLDGPWAEGIDASKVEIELDSRLIPPRIADVLLTGGEDTVLVSRRSFNCLDPKVRWLPGQHNSHLLLVANGSFLFNVPLVNHEHRKLAGRLIAEVGTAKRVVILDSQNHHPISLADENKPPEQTPRSMLDVFDVWPLSAVLVQWGILIVALCFSKWAIFGPPRDPPPAPASDFGRHVAALGDAMAVTGDAAYAQARVQQYRQLRDAAGPRAINRTNLKHS